LVERRAAEHLPNQERESNDLATPPENIMNERTRSEQARSAVVERAPHSSASVSDSAGMICGSPAGRTTP